jgi:hypothetical protein
VLAFFFLAAKFWTAYMQVWEENRPLSFLVQQAWDCRREEIKSRGGYASREVDSVANTLQALGINYHRDVVLGDHLMLLQIIVDLPAGALQAMLCRSRAINDS